MGDDEEREDAYAPRGDVMQGAVAGVGDPTSWTDFPGRAAALTDQA